MLTLCAVATINGNYPGATGVIPELRDACFTVTGTFDGATVALQVSHDDGITWVAVASGAFTAAGTLRMQLGADMKIRAVITSAGASTSLTVKAS